MGMAAEALINFRRGARNEDEGVLEEVGAMLIAEHLALVRALVEGIAGAGLKKG